MPYYESIALDFPHIYQLYISILAVLSEAKAIHSPSGEKTG